MAITPKQAFEAAKVLDSGLVKITIDEYGTSFHYPVQSLGLCSQSYARVSSVDWPKGTDQYPLPEPEWVDAVFPDDVGKVGRFSDDGKDWYSGTICGRWRNGNGCWINGVQSYTYAQVQKVKT